MSTTATLAVALVICRHPDGRYLLVREKRDRGWWLPAGRVEAGEQLSEGALREVKEEAGLDVRLTGLLRVEHSVLGPSYARMRAVYFAEPVDPTATPKQEPDEETEEARWFTIEEIRERAQRKRWEPGCTDPGLRGQEAISWPNYIERGGAVFPLTALDEEQDLAPPVERAQPFVPCPQKEQAAATGAPAGGGGTGGAGGN